MDPRHPQHPFSRNPPPSYSHAPFQSNASQAPFPPSSRPTNPTPLYPENPRRPAENNYYPQSTSYPRDSGGVISGAGHSRHTSISSISHGTPTNRSMPPPLSPQQQQQQPLHAQHPHAVGYPQPSLSRGPPPPLATPTNFQNSRDLPSISSVHRPSSVNSSMSISSMLGGPPDSREPAQPASQYSAPPPMMASAPPPTSFPAPVHASPRSSAIGLEYGRFRRPRTPDARASESQGLRDRANSAGSPPGAGLISTPEGQRYGASQGYPQRVIQHQHSASLEDRRDHYPMRVPNPNNTFPPRPSSQPTSFSGPPPPLADSIRRPAEHYDRLVGYNDREVQALQERARHEEEMSRREREFKERERQDHLERLERSHFQAQPASSGQDVLPYGRQYGQQPAASYNDPRESAPWLRRHEQQGSEQAPVTSSYDYPRTSAYSYSGPVAHSPPESRYPPNSYGSGPTTQRSSSHSQYDSPIEDRQRPVAAEQPQQQSYQGPGQPQPAPYRPHESSRVRTAEETQQLHQRGYPGLQEFNRRGRNSPFPQAVQGAQIQHTGPGGEPGIKSEFGKMFSGIGSGVGSMNIVGASSSGVHTPFSNSGQLRREDLDGLISQDSPGENGAHKLMRSSSRGGRRRKLKEEDSRGDDDNSSTGRRTPSGRGPKRPKIVHQHSIGLNQRHLTRQDSGENTSSPSQPTFAGPAAQPAQSPTSAESKIIVPHHHHINRHHHHHHHTAAPHRSTPAPVAMPKPKRIVKSRAVLDSVVNLPRHHLGHGIYQSILECGDPPGSRKWGNTQRGFASTPHPLPRFEGMENCTFTVRVARVHLTSPTREEITSRRGVWGTDVYTDDSDIIAACIHAGWIRGEWSPDIDVSLLGLELDSPETEKNGLAANGISPPADGEGQTGHGKAKNDITLNEPPAGGPMIPPTDCDLHVTVLILPPLEKYSSTTRFGIKSRSWQATHDGLSFMILSIKWVHGVDTAKEATGEGRRSRMQLAIPSPDTDEKAFWDSVLESGDGSNIDYGNRKTVAMESFVRGDGNGPLAEMTGLGMGSWWKEREKRNSKTIGKDVEVKVEERPGDAVQADEATVAS